MSYGEDFFEILSRDRKRGRSLISSILPSNSLGRLFHKRELTYDQNDKEYCLIKKESNPFLQIIALTFLNSET